MGSEALAEFGGWKQSLLCDFEDYLEDEEAISIVTQQYRSYARNVTKLLQIIVQIEEHIERGTLTDDYCSVRARRCLSELAKQMALVSNKQESLVPSTLEHQRKCGFSKYHLGAVLVSENFSQYSRMMLALESLTNVKPSLESVADRTILEEMDRCHTQFHQFCSVMSDLGMNRLMRRRRHEKLTESTHLRDVVSRIKDNEEEDDDATDADFDDSVAFLGPSPIPRRKPLPFRLGDTEGTTTPASIDLQSDNEVVELDDPHDGEESLTGDDNASTSSDETVSSSSTEATLDSLEEEDDVSIDLAEEVKKPQVHIPVDKVTKAKTKPTAPANQSVPDSKPIPKTTEKTEAEKPPVSPKTAGESSAREFGTQTPPAAGKKSVSKKIKTKQLRISPGPSKKPPISPPSTSKSPAKEISTQTPSATGKDSVDAPPSVVPPIEDNPISPQRSTMTVEPDITESPAVSKDNITPDTSKSPKIVYLPPDDVDMSEEESNDVPVPILDEDETDDAATQIKTLLHMSSLPASFRDPAVRQRVARAMMRTFAKEANVSEKDIRVQFSSKAPSMA